MIPAFAAALLRRGKRLRSFAATARQALRLASLAQGRARLIFVAAWTAAFVVIGGSTGIGLETARRARAAG